jgi:hypothetical protein
MGGLFFIGETKLSLDLILGKIHWIFPLDSKECHRPKPASQYVTLLPSFIS